MTGSGRVPVAVIAVLLIFLAVASGCSGVPDGIEGQAEQRVAVRLPAAGSEHLRRGMRQYLASVQGAIDGLSRNDWAQVSDSAQKAGVDMLRDVSASVAVHLPPKFLMLSMDTHQKFDALAHATAAGDSKTEMMTHLSAILANCMACHASYRLAAE